MAKTTTVNLPKDSSGTKLTATAEWWEDKSRFAVVRFHSGEIETFALRLDLDKRIFLDHAPDKQVDRVIQSHVQTIWGDVVRAKQFAQSV